MLSESREWWQNIFRDVFDDSSVIMQDEMVMKDIEEGDSLTHIQLIGTTEQQFNIRIITAEIAEQKKWVNFSSL